MGLWIFYIGRGPDNSFTTVETADTAQELVDKYSDGSIQEDDRVYVGPVEMALKAERRMELVPNTKGTDGQGA